MGRIRFVATRLPLAIESAVALTLASAFVATRSQSKTTRLLGHAQPVEKESEPRRPPVPVDALRIGRAIERTAAVLPWHPLCLPTAVATVWLLRRRRIPCEAHLGITATAPPLAHAWVTVHGTVVQGGDTAEITELAAFV
jgi:hypothetical protein